MFHRTILHLFLLCTLLAPVAAEAAPRNVSNLGQADFDTIDVGTDPDNDNGPSTNSGAGAVASTHNSQIAQAFTTGGSSAERVRLVSVVFPFKGREGDAPGDMSLAIHAANGINPGRHLATLSGFPRPVIARDQTWTAPAGVVLRGSATYFVVFSVNNGNNSGAQNTYDLWSTDINNEDDSSSPGWSIADTLRWKPNAASAWITSNRNQSAKIRVNADTVNTGTTPIDNRAPTAGNIINRSVRDNGKLTFNIPGVFNDPDGDALTYTVSCADTGIATGGGVSGTVVTINGVFPGSTQCTVNASDGSLSVNRSFTITVTGEQVSNLGRTTTLVGTVGTDTAFSFHSTRIAQEFTTGGTSADRFQLVDIAFDNRKSIGGDTGNLNVFLHEANPENISHPLTAPLATLTGVTKPGGGIIVYTPSSQLLLKGNSGYFVHWNVTGGSGDPNGYEPRLTSAGVDANSSTGWSIGGGWLQGVNQSYNWQHNASGNRLKIRVRTASAQANRAPTTSTIAAQNINIAESVTIDVAANFTDPDGDTLSYTATSSDANVATVSVSGSEITINALKNGSAQITVRASDGNAAAVQMFTVTVTGHAASNILLPTVAIVGIGTVSSASWYQQRLAQGFVTGGTNAQRFPLLDLTWNANSARGTPGDIVVTLHEANPARPNHPQLTAVATLTGPARPYAGGHTTFTSPPAFNLKGNTQYFVVWDADTPGDNQAYRHWVTLSDDEDASNSDGWGINNVVLQSGGKSWNWNDFIQSPSILMRVRTADAITQANRAPTVGTALPATATVMGGESITVNISGAFTDPDGDFLNYTVTSSAPNLATARVEGERLIIDGKGFSNGTAQITVHASDGALSATQTIALTVTAGLRVIVISDARTETQTLPDDVTVIVTETGSITTPSGSLALRGAGVNNAVESGTINNRGTITSTNADAVIVRGANSLITNSGRVQALTGGAALVQYGGGNEIRNLQGGVLATVNDAVVQFDGGNAITHAGAITTTTADAIVQAGSNNRATVTGTGTIDSARHGIRIDGDAATVTVLAGARIEAKADGIRPTRQNSRVQNAGLIIAGDDSIEQAGGGAVAENESGGRMEATDTGMEQTGGNNTAINHGVMVTERHAIWQNGGNSRVINSGRMHSTREVAVIHQDGDNNTITIATTGSVTTTGTTNAHGLLQTGRNNTINSAGTVITNAADTDGIRITSTGNTVTLLPGAFVQAVRHAVVQHAGNNTLTTQSGGRLVSAADGIHITDNGNTVTHAGAVTSTGVNAYGIYQRNNGNTITVSGTVHAMGSAADGIRVEGDNNTITLQSGAVITAGRHGVSISGNGNTVIVEAGVTFNCGGMAVDLGGNTLVNNSGGALGCGAAMNTPPVVRGSLAAVALTAGLTPADSAVVDVSTAFMDADGDTLSYSATSSAIGIATVALSGANVTITAVAAGNAVITVMADDGNGGSAMQTIAVQVAAAPVSPGPPPQNPLALTAPGDSTFTAGTAITALVLDAATGGDGTYNYTLTGLPAGLAFAPATRTLSGTPTAAAAAATVTYGVSDGSGSTANATFVITVVAAAPQQNRAPVAVGGISAQMLTLGDAPVTLSLTGLFSDADAGDVLTYSAISSAPLVAAVTVSNGSVIVRALAAGNAVVTVMAADPDGASASVSFAVNVAGAMLDPLAALRLRATQAEAALDAARMRLAALQRERAAAQMRLSTVNTDLASVRMQLAAVNADLAAARAANTPAQIAAAVAAQVQMRLIESIDLNRDGVIDADDFLIMYYAEAHAAELGDGNTGGTAAARARMLAGLRGALPATDATYQLLLRRANALGAL